MSSCPSAILDDADFAADDAVTVRVTGFPRALARCCPLSRRRKPSASRPPSLPPSTGPGQPASGNATPRGLPGRLSVSAGAVTLVDGGELFRILRSAERESPQACT